MDIATNKTNTPHSLAHEALENLKTARTQVRADRIAVNQLVQLDPSFQFVLDDNRAREKTIVDQIVVLNQFIQKKFRSPKPSASGQQLPVEVAVAEKQTVQLSASGQQLPSEVAVAEKQSAKEKRPTPVGFTHEEDCVGTSGLKFQTKSKIVATCQQEAIAADLTEWPQSDSGIPDDFEFTSVSEQYPSEMRECGCVYNGGTLILSCLEHATF